MSIESLISVPSFLTATTYASGSSSDDCGHLCESSCQLNCENSSQCSGCQGSVCEAACQNYCQNSGQCGSCESTCENQGPCIGGQGLPCGNEERGDCGGCEDGCQDCQTSCQNSCQSCQTNGQKANIDPWSWSSSNGFATAAQTAAAYNAITNNGFVSDFSYVVWNDMVSKANNVLSASSGSWNSKYATYSDTLINAADKTLTATKFNSLRYNIGLRASTGISEVSTGDTVYGSYFIILANSLNSWIDNVNS